MPVQVINITKYLILFIVSIFLTSCTAAYNSIQFTQNEGSTLSKLEHKSKKSKFKNNIVFVNVAGEIIQLKNVKCDTLINNDLTLSGETTMLDHHYEYSYNVMKLNKRDRMNELEVAGPKSSYFKQTHIFADSVTQVNGKIQVHEKHVQKITMYYRARVLLYILIVVGTGAFLLLYIIYFN